MSEMREPTEGGSRPDSTRAGESAGGAMQYGNSGITYGVTPASSALLRLGGALGIAACVVGLLVFVVACMGLNKVIVLSLVPVGLALPGLVISIIAAIKDKSLIAEDTHVLQALFVNLAGLFGGVVMLAVWMHWPIFHK